MLTVGQGAGSGTAWRCEPYELNQYVHIFRQIHWIVMMVTQMYLMVRQTILRNLM